MIVAGHDWAVCKIKSSENENLRRMKRNPVVITKNKGKGAFFITS